MGENRVSSSFVQSFIRIPHCTLFFFKYLSLIVGCCTKFSISVVLNIVMSIYHTVNTDREEGRVEKMMVTSLKQTVYFVRVLEITEKTIMILLLKNLRHPLLCLSAY